MAAQHVINVDLAEIYASATKEGFIRTLAWGDYVEVVKVTTEHVEVRITKFVEQSDGSIKPEPASGFIKPLRSSGLNPADVVIEKEDNRVLKVNFVDVQQGDGSVIETPKGKVILVDGGDNQLFARYLAGRYRGTSDAQPKEIDCIVVTHGDADHFAGLTEIQQSETHPKEWKRLFIHPRRVYHNGLVKRPSEKDGRRRKDTELLGETRSVDEQTLIITGLEINLLEVDDTEMNKPFRDWKKALEAFKKRGEIKFRRLEKGDDDAFDFLANEDIKVEVLGPLLTKVGDIQGLKFLGKPKKGPRIGHESLQLGSEPFEGKSASHTINGHSIIFRLTYGGFRFLFSGDLNDEAGRILTSAHDNEKLSLQSEVFKAPHHGSADFSAAFIKAVSPVISVVSSGDESSRKEFIHPRATLIGALGKYSRIEEPLIFVTELVAFFQMEGNIQPERHKMKNDQAVIEDGQVMVAPKAKEPFFAFSRAAFGLVKVRTDGQRLLVYTDSGQVKLKEVYAYRMDASGNPIPDQVRKV